jgi:hypothetical protein
LAAGSTQNEVICALVRLPSPTHQLVVGASKLLVQVTIHCHHPQGKLESCHALTL